MNIKVNTNAAEEVKRLGRFVKDFETQTRAAITETIDIARVRVLENHLMDGRGVKGNKGHITYYAVPGANIRKRHTWRTKKGVYMFKWGALVWHKNKVVSQIGKFQSSIKKGSPDNINETVKYGDVFHGYFGVKGSIANMWAMHEFGNRKVKKRAPLWKGFQWAGKRFMQILVSKIQEVKLK